MFANFFPNFLVGLREGLEAALVVSILIAYLVKTDRREALRPVAYGVAAAIGLSLAFGAFLQFTVAAMTFEAQEILGGSLSIVAVAFVTYMIFWMRRTARTMKAELEGRMSTALAMGTGAIVLTAFLAVGREGLETTLFLWSTIASTGSSTVGPVVGAFLGILTAVAMAYLVYRRAVKINLARFFKWTGVALVFVAAGVLSYGFHDLQEASVLPGIGNLAFDVSDHISVGSWYGTLLKGIFNFSPAMTVVECAVWLAYFIPVMYFFLRPGKPPVASIKRSEPVRTPASVS